MLPAMKRTATSAFSRRLAIASVVFGLFVLADILLFGWLIFRDLSQREIDRVLLETRAEARDLAQRIAERAQHQDTDLYLLMATINADLQADIDAGLLERAEILDIEIFDDSGTLVYQQKASQKPGEEPDGEGELSVGPSRIPRLTPKELPGLQQGDEGGDLAYEIREQIGELGSLKVGLSPAQLRQRAAVLRSELISRMVWIVVVSLAVLLSAYVIIWLLLLRARRLEERAAEADRLAYIGTLAAGLAHEIRNPLNSLNLNMQLLEEELGAPGCQPTSRRLLGITQQEISRLERLVTDFLAYARPRPLELEEVAPSALLVRAREVLDGEFRSRGARVEVEDASGGALVKVDPGQINQLLLNLTQNALAATEGTGRPPVIRLTSRLEGNRVELAVEDNGCGIPPEEAEKVFDIFYSTKKGGTGLGLAVVQRIAKNHDGELSLQSQPGTGTRVVLALPVASLTGPATADGRPLLEPEPLTLASRGAGRS